MGIKALLKEVSDLKTQARAILDGADANNDGVLTAEQIEQVDALQEKIDAREATIKRRQAFADASAQPIPRQLDGGTSKTSATITNEPLDNGLAGFATQEEYFHTVAQDALGRRDERLAAIPQREREFMAHKLRAAGASNAQIDAATGDNSHSEASSDGNMVPTAIRDRIWSFVFDEDSILSQVDSEPTAGNSVELLTDQTTPWGSTGIQAYWENEGATGTESRVDTNPVTVKMHKLMALVTANEELVQDAARLASRLMDKAPLAIRWKACDAIHNGNGVGKPLGILNSDGLVSVAKESGQAAQTIEADNIAKMYARLLPGSYARAVWKINPDVIDQLITMTLGDQPIWTPPASGLVNAPGGVLLGRPVQFSEHCQTIGTKGDIRLIDPMGYYAITKPRGIQFASSMHLLFDKDKQAFRWTFRLGGRPYLNAAQSPANGSNTKSHFVTLDTRA